MPRAALLLLVMAIGFGVIAALLASPWPSAAAPAASSGASAPSGVSGLLIAQIVAIGIFLAIAGYIAYRVAQRLRGAATPYPGRIVVVAIVSLLLASAFVVVAHFVSTALAPGGKRIVPSSNSSTGTSPPAPSNGTRNGSLLPAGFGNIPGIPGLSWFTLGIAVLAVGVAAAGYLLLASRGVDRDDEPDTEAVTAARLKSDLEESLRMLSEDADADPREVIRALYRRLLLTLQPRLGELAELTAREIEHESIDRFSVRRDHAGALTGLFEEARYSTHFLARMDADRARRALSEILRDLDAWSERRASVAPTVPPAP